MPKQLTTNEEHAWRYYQQAKEAAQERYKWAEPDEELAPRTITFEVKLGEIKVIWVSFSNDQITACWTLDRGWKLQANESERIYARLLAKGIKPGNRKQEVWAWSSHRSMFYPAN